MMANCHDLFQEFEEKIVLHESKRKYLRKGRNALRRIIRTAFRDADRSPLPDFKGQGSYAMSTIINPIKGEYDIDDGIYLRHLPETRLEEWPTPATVHAWIVDAVKGHTDTSPIDKRTCVRVVYAGDYHIDLPIYGQLDGKTYLAEKADKGWHESDPESLTTWFADSVKAKGQQLRRMVRYFKAWADYRSQEGKMPSALILTVLVTEEYGLFDRDDSCFGDLTQKIRSRMLGDTTIINPVDPDEDLYERAKTDEKNRFIKAMARVNEAAQRALGATDKPEACREWRACFGDRWPSCDDIEEESKQRYTKRPAILRDDARSA